MDNQSQEWFTGDHFERYTRCMAAKKIDLGGTGETVKENVKRLRGGMQYKELSERLSKLGRPIPPLGLRRIEAGERRVDVDDLVALAVAFDVSPLTILLPADASNVRSSPLTGVPDREVAHSLQWAWGEGSIPLSMPWGSEEATEAVDRYRFRAVANYGVNRVIGISRDAIEGSPDDPEVRRLAKIHGVQIPDELGVKNGDD